jgi:phage baseplate assembly protein W|tara:strand:- start:7395 stop:7871 length:477 start_codon:yes stop_codon:yes gene_type:complete
MASINLDIITQADSDRGERAVYTDLHFDLSLNYTRSNELEKQQQIRDIITDQDVGAIRNAFISLLTTSPGEKILNPLFGINFGDLLFLPVNEERAGVIGSNIITNISKFEPRIKVLNLEITPVIESQEYICDFVYNIPRFNNQRLQLKGNLSQSGFYV